MNKPTTDQQAVTVARVDWTSPIAVLPLGGGALIPATLVDGPDSDGDYRVSFLDQGAHGYLRGLQWFHADGTPCGPTGHRVLQSAHRLASVSSASADERRGIYVASRASIPERAAMWRQLRASGVIVNSSWIDEDGEGQTADWGELWQRIEREVKQSRALILYAEPDDFPLKGAFVEAGMAIGAGLRVFVVAPGVELGSYGCRPIGSWASHPLVQYAASVDEALAMLAASPEPVPATNQAEEVAVEAVARAMCDRVNGVGDYDENIQQRRSGWIKQAKAGIAAYLAATHPATNQAGEVERLIEYLFGDQRNGDGLRVVDLCFTSFMNRDKPNPEDGEKSDWFTDTKPLIDKDIAALKDRLLAALATQPATSQEGEA